jgi:hypothetical protein
LFGFFRSEMEEMQGGHVAGAGASERTTWVLCVFADGGLARPTTYVVFGRLGALQCPQNFTAAWPEGLAKAKHLMYFCYFLRPCKAPKLFFVCGGLSGPQTPYGFKAGGLARPPPRPCVFWVWGLARPPNPWVSVHIACVFDCVGLCKASQP